MEGTHEIRRDVSTTLDMTIGVFGMTIGVLGMTIKALGMIMRVLGMTGSGMSFRACREISILFATDMASFFLSVAFLWLHRNKQSRKRR